MRAALRSEVAGAVVLLALVLEGTASVAAPLGYTALKERIEVVDIKGHAASISYTPAFQWHASEGKVVIGLHVDGNLGEVQKALGGALDGKPKDDECGERLTVSGTHLDVVGEAARLSGHLHYELWKCVLHIKTRLLEQSGDVCVDLKPLIVTDGKSIRLSAKVMCATASGVLGELAPALGLEGALRDLAQHEVDTAVGKLSLAIPQELANHDLRLISARFYDRGGNVLGIEAHGAATLTDAEFQDILPKLIK